MINQMTGYAFDIGDSFQTEMKNENGIYQDGTTPMYRDIDGKLWAMSGHTHMGHIAMLCGTCISDLKECYPIQQNFCTGHAEYRMKICEKEARKMY